eukprot:COSAG01_NODE_12666_length_1702_cov_2.509046_1_plen_433_part_10
MACGAIARVPASEERSSNRGCECDVCALALSPRPYWLCTGGLRRRSGIPRLTTRLIAGSGKSLTLLHSTSLKWPALIATRCASVFARYIEWTKAAFPSGSAELRAVLERCTRECLALQRYEQDIRFLKAWIQYADCCTDGDQVFEYMSTNSIGTTHALFYIAKAAAFEHTGNFNGAARTFEDGAKRGATPIGKLQRGKRDFERRMNRRMSQREAARSAPSTKAKERAALQKLSKRSAASSHRPMKHRNGADKRGGRRARESQSCGQSNFRVFADGGAERAPVQGTLVAAPTGAVSSGLASHHQRHKENNGAATAWNEAALGNRARAPDSAAPSFSIFDDEIHSTTGVAHRTDKSGLRTQLEASNTVMPVEECLQRSCTEAPPNEGNIPELPAQVSADHHTAPSPTVNTAVALGEVMQMFGGPVLKPTSSSSSL